MLIHLLHICPSSGMYVHTYQKVIATNKVNDMIRVVDYYLPTLTPYIKVAPWP